METLQIEHIKELPKEEEDKIHQEIIEALRDSETKTYEAAVKLLEYSERMAYQRRGWHSLGLYAEHELGIGARKAEDLITLARRLRSLPKTQEALKAGKLPWTKAREIAKVATPETEESWIETARVLTSRQLEGLVRSTDQRGEWEREEKNDRGIRSRNYYQVVMYFTPETISLLEQVRIKLSEKDGVGYSLEDSLKESARRILGDGESLHGELVVHRCPDCKKTWQMVRGEKVAVSETLAERAECDGSIIEVEYAPESMPQPEPIPTCEDEPALTCEQPEDDVSIFPFDVDPETIEDYCDHPKKKGRKVSPVPPRLRRTILERVHHTCEAPGCHRFMFLEIHHIKPRSEGGSNREENLVAICFMHHFLIHNGVLSVERLPDFTLKWWNPNSHAKGQIPHQSPSFEHQDGHRAMP